MPRATAKKAVVKPATAKPSAAHKRVESTPGDPRGVFFDLFDEELAFDLQMRADLLVALRLWLEASGKTQTKAAEVLGVTQARVSNIKNGKLKDFSLEQLVKLAGRAGLNPQLTVNRAA